MNFNEYRPQALRTAKMFPTVRENMRHAILGMMTEGGELATEIKRMAVYGKPLTDVMLTHMREESGDVLWYVPLAMWALGEVALPELSDDQIGSLPTDLADIAVYMHAVSGGIASWYAASNGVLAMDDSETLLALLAMLVILIDGCVAPALGTTGDTLRADNIEKLRLRFPEAYSDAAAEARADKGGLDARNS
jgi:hypothetical protein